MKPMQFTLEQLRSGDPSAWDKAFGHFFGLLMGMLGARFQTLAIQDHEDVARDAILKLIDHCVDTAQSLEELTKAVVVIARNLALDELDKRKAQKRGEGKIESLEGQPEGTEPLSSSSPPTPLQEVEQQEQAFLVRAAVEQLPERYRDVLLDYYFLGLKQQEIADKRGMKIGSIGVYLARGQELLEPILKNLGVL